MLDLGRGRTRPENRRLRSPGSQRRAKAIVSSENSWLATHNLEVFMRSTVAGGFSAFTVAIGLSTTVLAQQPHADSGDVRFAGRSVDAAALLKASRYANWTPVDRDGLLFYTDAPPPGDAGRLRDPVHLYSLRMPAPGQRADPTAGHRVSDTDWGERGIYSLTYSAPAHALVVYARGTRADPGDRMFRVPLEGGQPVMLTTDTLTSAVVGPDARHVALVSARRGHPGQFCLRLVEVATASLVREICEGPGGSSLRPWLLVRSPDGRGVALPIVQPGHSDASNAMVVELFADPRAAPRVLLLPDSARRINLNVWSTPNVVRIWERRGGTSVRVDYELRTGQSTPVVESLVPQRLRSWQVTARGRPLVVSLHESRDSVGTAVRVRDATSGRTLGEWYSRDPLTLQAPRSDTGTGPAQGVRFMTFFASPTRGRWADDLRITIDGDRASFTSRPLLHTPEVQRIADQCRVRRVSIPTWDTDSTTGRPRLLSGYLYEPVRPVTVGGRRVAVILAYYGGGESYESIYSPRALVHCGLGVTFLSPAVRDVRGTIDDLMSPLAVADPFVGDVRDLVYSARFLERELGLHPEEIGLWGGSRGGGVSLRALTALRAGRSFPADERYRFAFGVAQGAGDATPLDSTVPGYAMRRRFFAKLLHDTAAVNDRAPFRHIDALEVPVLFLHGTEDPTAEIGRTRQRVKEAQGRGLPVEWIEFPGEGHNFATLRGNIALFRAQFAFMERAVAVPRRTP